MSSYLRVQILGMAFWECIPKNRQSWDKGEERARKELIWFILKCQNEMKWLNTTTLHKCHSMLSFGRCLRIITFERHVWLWGQRLCTPLFTMLFLKNIVCLPGSVQVGWKILVINKSLIKAALLPLPLFWIVIGNAAIPSLAGNTIWNEAVSSKVNCLEASKGKSRLSERNVEQWQQICLAFLLLQGETQTLLTWRPHL